MTQNVSKDRAGWTKPVLVELGSLLDVSAMLVPAVGQCNKAGECKS